jgi:hypothetical protein
VNSMCGICHMISLSGKCQIETELSQFQKKNTCLEFYIFLAVQCYFEISISYCDSGCQTHLCHTYQQEISFFYLAGVAKCTLRCNKIIKNKKDHPDDIYKYIQ